LALFNRYLAPYMGAGKKLSEAHYD
jgi:hypothetical protein